MTDRRRLNALELPPGVRVTLHFGELPSPAEDSSINGPLVRVEVWQAGEALASIDIAQRYVDTLGSMIPLLFEADVPEPAQRGLNQLAQLAKAIDDDLVTAEESDDVPRRLVEVYCARCGNRKATSVTTREQAPYIVRLTEKQIELTTDPGNTCGVCGGGPISVRDVAEPQRPPTKMYEFRKRDD